MPENSNQKIEEAKKPMTDETAGDSREKSESYDSLIEEQKGAQTARDHDHFQADSSLSSET